MGIKIITKPSLRPEKLPRGNPKRSADLRRSVFVAKLRSRRKLRLRRKKLRQKPLQSGSLECSKFGIFFSVNVESEKSMGINKIIKVAVLSCVVDCYAWSL